MEKIIRLTSAVLALASVVFCSPSAYSAPAEDQIGNYRKEGVDVVQGRIFRKGGRHEIGLDLGLVPDNQFLFYEMIQGRYAYHFQEAFAFEISGSQVFNQERNIIGDLEQIDCAPDQQLVTISTGAVSQNCGIKLNPGPDPWKNIAMANFIWSPIYGKFALFSKKIFHFDLYLLAGAGLFHNEDANRFGFNVGAGMKVFLNEWIAMRFDIRNLTVREGSPFNQIANNRQFNLGVSFFFPTTSSKK